MWVKCVRFDVDMIVCRDKEMVSNLMCSLDESVYERGAWCKSRLLGSQQWRMAMDSRA